MGYVKEVIGKKTTRYRAWVNYGKQVFTKTHKTQGEAWRWVEDLEAALRNGTVRERATLEDVLNGLREQGKSWSKKHEKDIESLVRGIGDVSIYDMTPAWVEAQLQLWATQPAKAMVNGRAIAIKPNTSTTRRKKYMILSMLLQFAVKRRLLEKNPCEQVEVPKARKGRVRFLSEEERTRLLKACQASKQSLLYPLVVMALCTGARQGELLKLRWQDIDLKTGRVVFWDTKNGTHRGLVVPSEVVQFLHRLKRSSKMEHTRIFPIASMRKAWGTALEKAKIEDFRFHDLRHTTASMLLMQGRTLPEISGVLGHLSAASTKRYAHLDVAHTKQVLQGMAGWVLG